MLTITIQLDPRDKTDTLDLHLEAIGFKRAAIAPSIAKTMLAEASPIRETLVFNEAGFVGGSEQHEPEPDAGYADVKAAMEGADDLAKAVETPARQPGQPSPGHKRRTKAEIAEDDAYFAGQAKPTEGSPSSVYAAYAAALESSSAPTVDPVVQAQDRADEARETAAIAEKSGLTHDDLRRAVGAYNKVHGLVAATKNIPTIIGGPMHEVPNTQEALADAIRKVEIATAAPSVTTEPSVAAKVEPSPVSGAPATKEGIIAAFRRYSLRFDGTDNLKEAANTNADGKLILKEAVGVDSLAQLSFEPDVCAKVIQAIDLAVMNNPFSREVRIL